MITAAVVSSLRVFLILSASRSSGGGALGRDQRHHADAGFEAGEPQHQQRERHQGGTGDVAETCRRTR